MKGIVYILQSSINGSYYVGSTSNLSRRIREHNLGKVISTKHWRPWSLAFSQEFDSLLQAGQIEKKIKSWKRRDFIEKIILDGFVKISGSGSVG